MSPRVCVCAVFGGVLVALAAMTPAYGQVHSRWPGDLDDSGGAPTLQDFASFQRCFGTSGEYTDCAAAPPHSSDFNEDGKVDLKDYRTFLSLWMPPTAAAIPCGTAYGPNYIERCGSECLPQGSHVAMVAEREVQLGPACVIQEVWKDRIQVIKNQGTLDLLLLPYFGFSVDFSVYDVILVQNEAAVAGGCWEGLHCINGIVDLDDGRRAVVVGHVTNGYLICMAMPWPTWRAITVPRSGRPTVMFFIEGTGEVSVTGRPVCE